MATDPPEPATERHARIRRAKRLLRFVPRRAVFHRYPVVGRFAHIARKRAYLWSFRREHVRPAIYFGSILSLWPLVGLQLPLALALSFAVRANFMIAGALQFITNPFTLPFVYYLTYRVGKFVLAHLGWGPAHASTAVRSPPVGTEEPVANGLAAVEDLPPDLHWTAAFGSTLAALVIGGTICGLILAVVLDLVSRPLLALRERRGREMPPLPPGTS